MNPDEVDFQTWHDDEGEPVKMFAFLRNGTMRGVEVDHCEALANLREHDPDMYEWCITLVYMSLERMLATEGMDA